MDSDTLVYDYYWFLLKEEAEDNFISLHDAHLILARRLRIPSVLHYQVFRTMEKMGLIKIYPKEIEIKNNKNKKLEQFVLWAKK